MFVYSLSILNTSVAVTISRESMVVTFFPFVCYVGVVVSFFDVSTDAHACTCICVFLCMCFCVFVCV